MLIWEKFYHWFVLKNTPLRKCAMPNWKNTKAHSENFQISMQIVIVEVIVKIDFSDSSSWWSFSHVIINQENKFKNSFKNVNCIEKGGK